MCDFSQGFKLCTCSKVTIAPFLDSKQPVKPDFSYWILKRCDSRDWMNAEIGRCFHPNFSQNALENAEFIGYYLNTELFRQTIWF